MWFGRLLATTCGTAACAAALLHAQGFTIARTGTFAPQKKTVLLLQDASGQKPVVLFQTALRVNTDGSPLSYHPQDLRGRDKALNNICNAVAVRRTGSSTNLCLSEFPTAIRVFEQFRDSGYRSFPDGFQITWTNVLAATKVEGRDVPCVFAAGPFQGHFGSLTALKNGLTGDKGECDLDDQVNPLAVPALVLVGGKTAVREFGARVGDLLVAFNPKTGRISSAIINDSGPPDNLGEGSVFLNMSLLGVTVPPANKAETFKLSIADQVLIAILPGTRSFEAAKPFTAANIDARVRKWQQEAGFETPDRFVEMLKKFQSELK